MAEPLLTTLYGMLDARTISSVAQNLLISEHSAEEGLRSAIAAVLGSVASKAESQEALRSLVDLAPRTLADNPLLHAARSASDPNSCLVASGRHLVPRIFGDSEAAVTNAVGAAAGLHAETATSLLAIVAPVVMGFIGNQALINGMNMSSLGKLLEREAPVIRNAQPAGLSHLFWPDKAHFAVAESGLSKPARHSARWFPVLAIALLAFGFVWVLGHTTRVEKLTATPKSAAAEAVGSASRDTNDPVEAVRNSLGNIELYFDEGSTRLRPESREQLEAIAKILVSNLDVHTTLTGHTDSAGERPQNFELSKNRAMSVMTQLIRKGVPSDRLSAEGSGDNHSPEGNSGAADQADHRKVTLEFSEH